MNATMTGRPYPQGLDCVWLATDSDGHVGAFVSAGVGPIPERVLSYEHGVIEDIEKRLMLLPTISIAQPLIANDVPSFVALAERGLFVYDWSDVHRTDKEATRTYEPVAVPVNPMAAADLPEQLRGFARCAIFDHCRFTDRRALCVASFLACREGDKPIPG